MKASSSFNILVDGVLVTTANSGADGTLTLSRAFGSSDVLKVQLKGAAVTTPTTPAPTPVPTSGIVRLNPVSSEITTLGDVDLKYKVTDTNGKPIVNGYVRFYIQHGDGGIVWTWGNAVTDSQGIAHFVYKALAVTGGATPGPTEYYNAWAVFKGCYAYQWVKLPNGSYGPSAQPFPVAEGSHIKVHLQAR
jgi:hypothetical protein